MKNRHIVIVVGVLLVLVAGLVGSFWSLTVYYKRSTFDFLQKQARIIGRNLENTAFEFDESLKYVTTTGQLERFLVPGNGDIAVIDAIRRFYSKHQDIISSIEIYGVDASRTVGRGKDNYFKVSPLRTNAELRGLRLHSEVISGEEGLMFIAPIYNQLGNAVANISVTLDLPRFLKQQLLNYYIGEDAWTWCLDSRGRMLTVLYSGGRERGLEGFRAFGEEGIQRDIARQLEGTLEHSLAAGKDVRVLSAYYPVLLFGESLGVILSMSQESLFQAVRSRISAISAFFLAITLWVALVFSFIVYQVTLAEKKLIESEEKLRFAKDQAEKALAVKNEFTSTVSHELRTPLAAMKLSIDILASEDPGKLTDDQKTFIGRVKSNIDRLARLINEVLDLSKLESGKMVMNMVLVDVTALAREVVEAQGAFVASRGLSIVVEAAPGLPRVMADRDRLVQVLNNLINNALKFTSRGGITIAVSYREPEGIVFCVRDTGIGIKPEDMSRLFEKFYQVGGASQQVGGTGLGLAICKEIVALHGGRIWVESTFGKGSEFYFSLPLARS